MYIFIYSIKMCGDYDYETKTQPFFDEKGIVCGSTYSEAVANLSKIYGENDIVSLEIKCISEDGDNTMPIEEELYNMLNNFH